jgi:heme/copper-type cytochrome/quinol oxidase subunit 1
VPLSEKSSAPSRWEYVFDYVLLVFFVLPALLWTAAGVLCSNTLSIGDPPVCLIPGFAPVVKLVQYLIVFNFILGGCLVTVPLAVIGYVGSTVRKRRRVRERGVQHAFAQYRSGSVVWVAATAMLVFVCVVSAVAIVDVVRALSDLVRAFLNSNN